MIDLVKRVSPGIRAPIVLFTYYNPIYQRGFETFVKEIADAGAKGLLVPDIPLEETEELSKICAKNGLDLVLLSTPTTPLERMEKIAKASNGFIYLVSVTGVTGVRTGVESRVEELVAKLSSRGTVGAAFAQLEALPEVEVAGPVEAKETEEQREERERELAELGVPPGTELRVRDPAPFLPPRLPSRCYY